MGCRLPEKFSLAGWLGKSMADGDGWEPSN